MSRIGKKPIPLPAGVKYTVEGNTVLVEGPKGKVTALIADGITLKTADGNLQLERASEDKAALHGLTRALVNNAVHGVTKGWTRELDIVGIGYRAELKGKGNGGVHAGLLASHRVSAAFGHRSDDRSQADAPDRHAASTGRRWARWRPTCARCASRIRTRTRVCATPTSG